MKKLFLVFTIAITALLTGCATTATQTPAQIAAQVCPPALAAVKVLQSDTGLSASAMAVVNQTAPQISAICSAASTTTSANLTALTNLAFNVVLPIAETADPAIAPDLVAVQAIAGIIEAEAVPKPTTNP